MEGFLNALVVFANFVFIPGLAYGAQLALGALGVTLVFGILRFSNFAHGDLMAFGTMITILVTWWLIGMGVTLGPLPTALLALPMQVVPRMPKIPRTLINLKTRKALVKKTRRRPTAIRA